MPDNGPNGLAVYRPYEAYDVIGRQLFRGRWERTFLPGSVLPHRKAAKAVVQRGGESAALILARANPDSDEYEGIQISSKRTNEVLNRLRELLSWGKVDAWKNTSDNQWNEIDCFDWCKENSVYDELLEQLRLHYHQGQASPHPIHIHKAEFDVYVGNLSHSVVEQRREPGQARSAGRPGFGWTPFREKLEEWEREDQLPTEHKGFRTAIGRMLLEWFQVEHPEKAPPKTETILRRLKPDLDRIRAEYYGGE